MTSGTSTHTLAVFIGHQKQIATISISVGFDTEISLTYEPSWVKEGFAVSPHLPLNGDFEHIAVRNYLQNLLPEGKGLEEITTNTTVSKNNTFGLIRLIGEETSGALSFRTARNSNEDTVFRTVTETELTEKLARFKETGESLTYWDGRTRLSVAGVQDKLNFLEIEGQLGFGQGKLCSNKIFKFETGKAPFIAVNELFTMLLAGQAGINVPHVELRVYGDVRAFVIERFDRRYVQEQQQVLRRHVIDGCQATNLPTSFKYERQYGDEGDGIYIRDGVSFPKLFAIKTTNIAAYQTQLLKWMTFNILTKNYDAHGKNISFFVGKRGLELAPFYDLVNIEAIIQEIKNSSISQSFAMSIGEYESGSAGNFQDPVTAYMLADFANTFNISLPRIQLVMNRMIKSVIASIETTRETVLGYNLSDQEVGHIDLCTDIIKKAAAELTEEIVQLPDMKDLF